MDKKGFITSPADLMKGLVIGFILGALFVYLAAVGVIPIAILPGK
ncbi:MAG TPA: hypothetical protein VJI46_03195 [Candidatus Nanoarchaeia archaeon]|nr:hypothetical protein [Candidatus Nanoarchaeia archaeon]